MGEEAIFKSFCKFLVLKTCDLEPIHMTSDFEGFRSRPLNKNQFRKAIVQRFKELRGASLGSKLIKRVVSSAYVCRC